jgi:hypothetical protein
LYIKQIQIIKLFTAPVIYELRVAPFAEAMAGVLSIGYRNAPYESVIEADAV